MFFNYKRENIKALTIALLFISTSFSNLFAQKTTTVNSPDWSKNATIYEVNVRQYTPEGTFKAFEKHLPELKALGVKILWFMPINPIGVKNRKGTLGSYYSISNYKTINPEYGTLDDFKELVKKAHQMGMKVLIDWVANHTAWDNVWVKTHPDFYTKDSAGKFVPPVKDWTDVIDLNYNNRKLWQHMVDAMIYWVKETNIDGFRADVAGMVPTAFWNYARKKLDKVKHVFMLAEWENEGLHKHAFDMTYAWEIQHIMKEIYKGKMNVGNLDAYIAREKKRFNPKAYRMTFTSNHDENSWNGTVTERFGKAQRTFAIMTFLVKGMPLIYSGQEAGLNKRLRFFDKDTINWKKSDYREIYKTLVHLKLRNKALWNGIYGGEMQILKTNDNKNIFAFVREKDGNKVIAIFNLSKKEKIVNIANKNLDGKYKVLFNKKDIEITDHIKAELKPWTYLVFYK